MKQAMRLSMASSCDRKPNISQYEDDDSDIEILSAPPRPTSKSKASAKPRSVAVKSEDGSPSTSKNSLQEQLRERNERLKRKADSELPMGTPAVKREKGYVSMPTPSSSKGAPKSSSASTSTSFSSSSSIRMLYPNGALRITRTPGREGAKNTVSLGDLVKKEHLQSACIFAFFIAQDELFRHLPLSKKPGGPPMYIGRDVNQDLFTPMACGDVGISIKNNKVTNKQSDEIKHRLRTLYKDEYGPNYNAFYAWSSGSAHSKIMLLVYPTFLRVVVTSCNMMDIDTVSAFT